MLIHTLESDITLAKTYHDDSVQPYPNAFRFTSHDEEVDSIEKLYEAVSVAAALGRCLLKGRLDRALHNESRAGATTSITPTKWICFDIDKSTAFTTPDQFMTAIGMGGVSRVVQYSASYGVAAVRQPKNQPLSCHIFVMLDKEMTPDSLKLWLTHLNFTVPKLAKDLALTNSQNALHYPLDITTCQNDKLLYVAPPIIKSNKIKDLMEGKRISMVKRGKPYASISLRDIPPPEQIKLDVTNKINDLRLERNLPPRRQTERFSDKHGVLYLGKPQEAEVTGIKKERGYTYLNLNGGDSWGYYHPDDNCEIIHNFKGEPLYLAKELLPTYYQEAKGKEQYEKKQATRCLFQGVGVQEDGTQVFAFHHAQGDAYYYGRVHPDRTVDCYLVGSRDRLKDGVGQYGYELPEIIVDWDITYRPDIPTMLDSEEKFLNRYSKPVITSRKGDWKPIEIVIKHALGANTDSEDDKKLYDHFLNWLAYIVQTGGQTRTAWILQGTQGTGKGTLLNHVLKPLLGRDNVITQQQENLLDKYNDWMGYNQIIWIDEAEMNVIKESKSLNQKLKTWICEPDITVRPMYSSQFQMLNFSNWIFASNAYDPVYLPQNDRRFNVGNYQEDSFYFAKGFGEELEKALPCFLHFLRSYKVREEEVHTPLMNEAKEQVIKLNKSSTEEAFAAIKGRNLRFFLDLIPNGESSKSINDLAGMKAQEYIRVLRVQCESAEEGIKKVLRDDMRTLVEFVSGQPYPSTTAFSRACSRFKCPVSPISYKSKSATGRSICWDLPPDWKSWFPDRN